MNEAYDYLFKIVVVGEAGVGKTSLIRRFVDGVYTHNYTSTVGVDFSIKSLDIDKTKAKLQIWDTAGQERFRTITTSYYRGAHAILVVYDCMSNEHSPTIKRWIEEIKEFAHENVFIYLIRSKTDVKSASLDEQNEIILFKEEILKKLNKNADEIASEETSAKDGTNVENMFKELTTKLIEKEKKGPFIKNIKNELNFANLKDMQNKRFGCC